MDPMIARRTWRTLEPIHGMIYFSPEAAAAYERLGLTGRMGYFASRAAPMGAVPVEVVIATFYNFRPQLVRDAIPEAGVEIVLSARGGACAGLRLGGHVVVSRDPGAGLDRCRHSSSCLRLRRRGL